MITDPVDLSALFLAFSLLMYVLLDGTDLGVGMLFVFFPGHNDRQRMAASILPIWDANETWLVLLGGGMLSLFPQAYGRLLTGLYLPLFLMLLALIIRAVALEYRSEASAQQRSGLDVLFFISSSLVAFSQGALAGNILTGVPIGGAFSWMSPFAMLCGVMVMVGYLLMGCCWIRWRLQDGAGEHASRLAFLFLVMLIVIIVFLCLLLPNPLIAVWGRTEGKILLVTTIIITVFILFFLYGEKPVAPLIAVLMLISSLMGVAMLAIYPWFIPNELSLAQAAAPAASQFFVLTAAAVIIPLTLIYNSWAFWVFRGKVR